LPAAAAPRPFPPPHVPDPQALTAFQQAMEALQQKQYRAAAERFRALLTRFPEEGALLDRSRVYLGLAERELNVQKANPRTIEERVTAATAALNTDQDAEAERLVRSVLADEPQHDLALYLMAAVEARRGDQEAAISFLSRAIGISAEVRAQARYDSDFESLRPSERFRQLVDPPGHASTTRRGRRR
jgi:tetratricopeptide (TPR) repeat protein